MRFDHFCHFGLKLKPFKYKSLWFNFYCHFGPKMQSIDIWLIKSCYFVIFLRCKTVNIILL
ncbi:hypothetical protein Hanom_Chr01g00073001 [Helianthus anomalus]